MLASQPYNCIAPELELLRRETARLYRRFNRSDEEDEQLALLLQIVGELAQGAFICPPFYCTYGHHIHLGKGSYINMGATLLDNAPIRIGAEVMIGPNVQIYTATGYSSQQWSFGPDGQSLKSATVSYRPSSSQERVRVQWRVYGNPDSTGGTEMTKACGGWWKATVPSAGSVKTGLSFSYGSTTDDNGGRLYDVKGESAAVSGGQAVTGITPNCAVA
mgnify:CR=1 FL=1